MTRIDAHHHVWDLTARPQVWMDTPGPGDPPEAPGTWANALRRNFGPEDLKPLLDKNAIDQTIVVQTVSSIDETREMLDLAASTVWIAGVVGWFDLTDPALPDMLSEFRSLHGGSESGDEGGRGGGSWDGSGSGSGGNRLVGVRHQVHDEPDSQWLLRPDVLRGLEAVADANLVYDLLIRTPHLGPALAAVRQVPHGNFVIDHIAKPNMAGGRDSGESGDNDPWFDGITKLAAEPNVTCKLSGMVTEADWANWTEDDLLPYARHVLAEFGPDRVMFGSDWPVCTLAASYDQVAATAANLLARCGIAPGSAESDAVFGRTAKRIYLS